MEFEVGMRVRVTNDFCNAIVGDEGVIIFVTDADCGIRFDRSSDGFHSCNLMCDPNHGHYVLKRYLEIIEDIQEIDWDDDATFDLERMIGVV